MATLTNTKIKDTYDGLLKTTDNEALDVSGVTLIEDGLGNASALSVGRSGNGVAITGALSAGAATLSSASVSGTIESTGYFSVEGTSGNTGGASDRWIGGDGTLGTWFYNVPTGSSHLFGVNNSNILTLNGSGALISGNLAVDTNTLYVDAANNRVGIGESSPSRPLHISADTPAIRLEDTTGSDYSELVSVNGDLYIRADEGNTEASSTIRFQIDQSERMRIDSSGNVGIGTTGGSGKLNVGASSASAVRHAEFANSQLGSSFSAGSFITLGRADINRSMDVGIYGNGSNEFDGKIVVNETGGSLILGTVGTERMRITSGGQLQVGGTAQSFNARIVVHRDTYSIESRSTGTGSEGHLVFRNANGAVGSIITSGSSTAYNTSSDYRLKENVVEMTGALDRVDALKPSRFNFIADPEKTVDGFLAHEVQAIVPEAVTGEKDAVDEEGNPIYQGIDQSKIVPLLVGAIKELSAKVAALESQLNA